MQRRGFLAAVAAAGAAPLLSGKRAESAQPSPAPVPDLTNWAEVRKQFLLDPSWIQMSQFFLASHPAPVRAALDAHRKGLDENPFLYVEDNVERFERATRAEAAAYLACEPDALAMTDSTSMGLGIYYGGLQLREGQEILSTTHDHPTATVRTLDNLSARTGAHVRRIPLYERSSEADPEQMGETLARALRPNTRIVAVTWLHSSTGVKTPIARFAEVVAKANKGRTEADRALLCVDGVHGFGIEDETVQSLGCDAFSAGCHKWLFGPRGTGLLWASPAGWAATRPVLPTMDRLWRKEPSLSPAALMTPGGFHSFEHRWALAEAFRFHRAIGKARIARRIHELNEQCKRGLAQVKRVKVHTPLSSQVSAGIVCFEVEGMKPAEVVERLKQRRIVASVTPPSYHVDLARLAPSLLTSPAEVDAAVRAVRDVAVA